MISIIVYLPYPIAGPSSRYRIYQYVKPLEQLGFKLSVHSIMTKSIYRNRALGNKDEAFDMFALSAQILKRFYAVLSKKNTITIVQRELSPIFRSKFHKFLASNIDGPLIYDFDDAVFLDFDISEIVKRANFIVPGNDYLMEYAQSVNPTAQTRVIPTVVDTGKYSPILKSKDGLVVGWIGTESTYRIHLAPRLRQFVRLAGHHCAKISVIGPRTILQDVESKGAQFIEWSLDTEVEQMAQFDIGLMPLFEDAFTRGKCAFKLIEYGAFGTPSIASPVGANKNVVLNGQTGFLVDGDQEWEQAFETLLTNPVLRREMGDAARERIVEHYSLHSQVPVWAEILHAAEKLTR
jgi:glycosyltransferase involved in cell wall biosynthesis